MEIMGGFGQIMEAKAMQEARAKAAARKRKFKSGMKVRVIKAPKGAEYLEGKIGMLVYKHSLATVEIDGRYTHFKYSEIEPVS